MTMPTEAELRIALAERVEAHDHDIAKVERALQAYVTTLPDGGPAFDRDLRRRLLAPALAVVVTVAVAVAVPVVINAALRKPTHAAPANPTPPPTTSRTPRADLGAGVVDVIGAKRAYPVIEDLRTDAEYLDIHVRDGMIAEVAAFSPAAHFTAARVGNATKVAVHGRPALYGYVTTWPANGRPDPKSGKQDGAVPSVAWQLDDGTWVVARGKDPAVYQPAADVALAESFGVHTTARATRIPFRVGMVPPGLRLTGVTRELAAGGTADDVTITLETAAGDHFVIELGHPMLADPVEPHAQLSASRPVGDQTLTVTGSSPRFTQSTLQSVLDTITVVADPHHPNATWPTLTQSIG